MQTNSLRLPFLFSLLLIVNVTNFVLAAPEVENPEESDFPPGLLGTYIVGDTRLERIDADVSFDWQSSSPDPLMGPGPFSANWQGLLLVKSQGGHRFHVYLAGEVEILIDGKTVLKGFSDQPQWISGEEIPLSFGEKELDIRYRKTGNVGAIKLFWSSEKFPIEPVSTYLLYREEGRPDLTEIEVGRHQFRALHCDRCHALDRNTQSSPAPSLIHAAIGLKDSWISQKLLEKPSGTDNMPHFKMTSEQAADIAAYLLHHKQSLSKLSKVKVKSKEDETVAGELLAFSTGCLACHTIGDLGTSGDFGGGTLDEVGAKRSLEWIAAWLKDPASLNPHHRMPVFQLDQKETQQLAVYLSSLKGETDHQKKTPQTLADEEQLSRGKKAIQFFGCVSCHEISGFEQEINGDPLPYEYHLRVYEELPENSNLLGCLAERKENSAAHQPYYPQANVEAIRAWMKNSPEVREQNAHHQTMDYFRGADLLIEKNCTACHPRDREAGLVAVAGKVSKKDPRLTGQSQGLIPPHLTAVGDRMLTESLAKGIRGELPKRLPWLSVRMPKFNHTESESKQLLSYLIGHDRLPDPIPDERLQLAEVNLTSAEVLLTGRELIGGRAFNCIACHKFGEYEPRNTALGTRGSDMLGLASRMRSPYFLRWTSSPLRIVPGMEMPSYNQPKHGFPIETIHEQLTVLWQGMNHPEFKAPSNPTVVEKYLVVQPGEPSGIVRDVFERTGSNKDRKFLARPLAIGLDNGHSLLFDLDAVSLHEWTYGDFAFQQTEGKSWFWHMAGAPVVKEFTQQADFVLRKSNEPSASLIQPSKEGFRTGRLRDYRVESEGVILHYEIDFRIDGQLHIIKISEHMLPLTDDKQSGFARRIEATDVPQGYLLALQQSIEPTSVAQPELIVQGKRIPLGSEEPDPISFQAGANGSQDLNLEYWTKLYTRATTPFPDKPQVTGRPEVITGTPGFDAHRLPLTSTLMPTALAWSKDRQMIVSSLKGDVFSLKDSDRDGLDDQLQLIQSGLAAPFGVHCEGDSLYVAHKPEILRIDQFQSDRPQLKVIADGWGHSENYHDWVTGFAQDRNGKLLIATGSDYTQKDRERELTLWRGDVLRLEQDSELTPIASALRYPIGIASDSKGRVFVSDQQGVQNCFNEINYIIPDATYGVPGQRTSPSEEKRAAIQIPHPWTRSVNGIFFIPDRDGLGALSAFRGHGVGCEYNNRFLVRFSLQEVNGDLQGACYELTKSAENLPTDAPVFLGPICGGVSPDGLIYIGNIHDSGWLGGQNTGEIIRLTPQNKLPNGIRELRATSTGFELEFLEPVSEQALQKKETYDLIGYTRIWEGAYASPDSGRYRPEITSLEVDDGGKTVRINVDQLKPSFVYELHLNEALDLFPASAYYTMNQIPKP
ncbi:MAG TPA: hypothetical protein DD473_24820 [Planctomycetaceae bacterium]|nr:hypothetical protein [Planctomycetaceae bacterium]